MIAKLIIRRLIVGCVCALSLVSNLQAQVQKSPPGTYFSAKDPDAIPYPFNPHPELPTVEVEPGVFIVDDTSIPDTQQQIIARKIRKAAAERAKVIASDPVLAAAAQAAQQAAQEATWAKNREEVAPWLVEPLANADGQPADFETVQAKTKTDLLDLGSRLLAKHQSMLETATNTATPTEMIFPNGERAILAGFENGHPVWNMNDGITQAVSIATAQVWPGGGAGFTLTGTNTTLGLWEAAGNSAPEPSGVSRPRRTGRWGYESGRARNRCRFGSQRSWIIQHRVPGWCHELSGR